MAKLVRAVVVGALSLLTAAAMAQSQGGKVVGAASLEVKGTTTPPPPEWVTDGKTYNITSKEGTAEAVVWLEGSAPLGVSLYVPDNGGSWWRLNFTAGSGRLPFGVGSYDGAVEVFGGAQPYISIFNNEVGEETCSARGAFAVSEFQFECDLSTGRPQLTRFAATFTQSCDGRPGKLAGKVRFTAPETGEPCDIGGGDDGGGEGEPTPPPPPPFQVVLPINLGLAPLEISNSGSASVNLSTAVDSTFNNEITLAAFANAAEWEDFHVSITPSVIPAPGAGEATLNIRTGPLTWPRPYIVTILAMTADQLTGSSFIVNVQCTPPFILGVDQPKSVAGVASGTQTTLEVKPGGSGPFFYQWYRGMPGMTGNPVQAENNSKFVLTARESGAYWVRVRNACGSVDSNAAIVTVAAQPLSARRGARP